MDAQKVSGPAATLANLLTDEDIGNQCETVWVARSWMQNGEVRWSKWRELSVTDILQITSTPYHSIQEIKRNEEFHRYLSSISHRQILKCEIVLDLDRGKESDQEYQAHVERVLYTLDYRGIKYLAYPPASKSWHIHIFCKNLRGLPNLREYKEWFIKWFGGDVQKANEKCLIALENVPHWKTGRVKKVGINKGDGINWLLPRMVA